MLELISPEPGGKGAWDAGVVFDLSDDPLVETVGDRSWPVLDQVLAANLVAGASILGVTRLDLVLPTFPYGYDQAGAFAALGDLRLSGTIPVLRREGLRPGLAFVPMLWAPTGAEARYLGDQGVGLGALVALAQEIGDFGWAANFGGRFSPRVEVRNVTWGSGLVAGLGGSWRLHERASAGVELHATPTLGFSGAQFPVEGLAHGRVRLPFGLWTVLGAGRGIGGGIGASRFRVVLGLGWSEAGEPPPRDLDFDGIDDRFDRCPGEPEDRDDFEDEDGCPDPDHDGDGVPDFRDGCVMNPEDLDGIADDDGCPEIDADQDGIPDGSDRCPLQPEDMDGNEDADGCPEDDLDTDHDGVPDFRDACPQQAIRRGQNPRTSDGCPRLAEISEDKIVITERVYFEEGKARLLPESTPVLVAVAQVLVEHPEIRDVLVEGHTNDVGDDEVNYRLSDARARAVMDWLIRNGVDRNRLTSKGYGETRPLVPNDGDENRARNRRVEFTILSRVSRETTP
jgi:outer membrane protein OmpA-like peptidoglycan-associated protein